MRQNFANQSMIYVLLVQQRLCLVMVTAMNLASPTSEVGALGGSVLQVGVQRSLEAYAHEHFGERLGHATNQFMATAQTKLCEPKHDLRIVGSTAPMPSYGYC
jgi:hypothetical protein